MDGLPPPSAPPWAGGSSIPKLRSLFPLYLSRFNAFIVHLHRLTLHTPSLDALLNILSSLLTLLLSLLPHPKSNPPRAALTALQTTLSDIRISLRLFSLLGIYTTLLNHRTPADKLLRLITSLSILSNFIFQATENLAWLGEKGVLKRREWCWGVSARAWMLANAVELVRLGRERWVVRGRVGEGVERKGEEDKEAAERERQWWMEVGSGAAYAPLTLHWSVQGGVLAEVWVGVLGVLAGGIGVREAWRRRGV